MTDDNSIAQTAASAPHPEFERGVRAAAEAMKLYFLDEWERSIHADLPTDVLDQHEAGAVADALSEERRRIDCRREHPASAP